MACTCRTDGCDALFDQLLALDFAQAEPYGRHHGVTVAAYGVQHPQRFSEAVRESQWQLLNVFAAEGIDGVEALQQRRKQLNSHRRGGLDEPDEGMPWVSDLPDDVPIDATIADVAGPDRTFPPEGYSDRVVDWVHALIGRDQS